ncbi:hypothetical protein A3J23_00090 [Candidatus Peregrinibacteria bacterium RIFCSPLOWO2_02_FULL_48_14]|nr:MAG: hypothetical protein A3J23_00090 [Candidatus Peregrinibacteria bacterium RIFCSPLOWO2_02_FULL_48_14]
MPKPFQVQDRYFQRAKEQGYRARSAFKLLEIQEKFHLIKPGQVIVDLGAAPGSFLQVIGELVGPKGRALGFDLQEIEGFAEKNIETEVVDIMEKEKVFEVLRVRGLEKVDGVTSDLAPKTSGIRDLDQGRSAELTEAAFWLATQILKPRGFFVGKIFEGPDMALLLKRMKMKFKQVNVFKPASSRDRSFETFIVARDYFMDSYLS